MVQGALHSGRLRTYSQILDLVRKPLPESKGLASLASLSSTTKKVFYTGQAGIGERGQQFIHGNVSFYGCCKNAKSVFIRARWTVSENWK
jgi:hypothetical protein